MLAQEVEGLADAGEHAERQHVDLHDAERVDVVLVPFDEGAVGHRRVADGHGLVEPAARQHEAADMLGEVAREADDLHGESHRPPDHGVRRVEAGLADLNLVQPLAPAAPHRVGEGGGDVLGEAQRLTDLADGAARAVADHGRGESGALAAVAGVDPLDHLLAPLMLEIDIDVGRFAPLGGDEALEQEVDLGGIDGRHPEAVAHDRVGGRAAALAQDARLPGMGDDVVDGEEIGRVAELRDEGELLVDAGAHALRHAGRVAPRRAVPGEVDEVLLRRPARRHGLFGIFVAQLVEGEAAALEEAQGLGHRLRQWRKRRAISAASFKCRSACASSRRPAVSMVTPSRMQASTSCKGRRSGAW